MGNIVSKLVMFSILLNLAAAITMSAVVDADGNRIFDRTDTPSFTEEGGDDYSDTYITELERSIQPAGDLDDKGDQIYRVLDMMSLGFVYRFVNMINEYMFGFVTMIDNVIGDSLDEEVRAILFGNTNDDDLIPNKFGVLKTLITISYILMGIYLFTGKDVVEGS